MRCAATLGPWALVIGAMACAPRGESVPGATATPVTIEPGFAVPGPADGPTASGAADAGGAAPAPARTLDEDAPLEEGRVVFVGMVRPTKGGHTVRGAVLEGDDLPEALARSAPAAARGDSDWFLGAKVRITAQLVRHDPPPRAEGEPIAQMRSGPWLGVTRLEKAELVAAPVVAEGTVARSKGLFQVGPHLVSREDLDWSLASGWKNGDRVRLWGQPRVVVCDPRAQCLVGGSIPMFDVGRAQKLP